MMKKNIIRTIIIMAVGIFLIFIAQQGRNQIRPLSNEDGSILEIVATVEEPRYNAQTMSQEEVVVRLVKSIDKITNAAPAPPELTMDLEVPEEIQAEPVWTEVDPPQAYVEEIVDPPQAYVEEIVISDYDILSKLLWCEAGSMGWEGQVYVCSSILNLADYSGRSIWDMAHDYSTFSVAGYVDFASPSGTTYEVVNYVMGGGRVYGVKYFRTDYYHDFGTPVCQIENVFFSN